MNLYDIFAFLGLFVGIVAIRFIASFIFGMVYGKATEDESFFSWMIDIIITSLIAAGFIVYFIHTGAIKI